MRIWFVYGGLALVFCARGIKYVARAVGERFKRIGRRCVTWGEDRDLRWGWEIFLKCYLVDAEIHAGGTIHRGPLYAMYRESFGGDALVLKFNWLASRSQFGEPVWERVKGDGVFKIRHYTAPTLLPNGDVWFSFADGWVVLYLGEPHSRLQFDGSPETLRKFAYF